MELRRLGPKDISILKSAVEHLLGSDGGVEGATRGHLTEALADPRSYFLVCLNDALPVGYLSAYRFPAVEQDGFRAYLYDVVVDPDHRLQGVGTRLIGALKEMCHADGVAHIWVGTALENLPAQRTCESTGARRVSEVYVEYVYELDSNVLPSAV